MGIGSRQESLPAQAPARGWACRPALPAREGKFQNAGTVVPGRMPRGGKCKETRSGTKVNSEAMMAPAKMEEVVEDVVEEEEMVRKGGMRDGRAV